MGRCRAYGAQPSSWQLLGYEDTSLERLFEREFAITGVTGGDLGTWLAVVMLADVENRIKAAAGGRN
jgi:ABC-type lipoprotein release transport system permease subunit